MKDINHLDNHGVHLLYSKDDSVFVQEVVNSSLNAKVKEKQVLDTISMNFKDDMGH